ncbi:MAG: response regulator, partial [Thermoanaerobaculia bacterium]|nr:response regulator [Thermoanaerobaculia bacterium]
QLAHTRRVHSLGRVAASIAHEFNNVLMGVQPNLEVLRRRATTEQMAPLTHVLQSIQRGKRITEEILRFTRPSEPDLACVGVGEFLSAWKREFLSLAGDGIEIDLESEGAELFMNADPLQIAQILTNLALNARDAMAGHGRIRISAELGKSFSSYGFGVVKTPDGFVHMKISDNGSGMTRETISHVFEPLFTTKRGGTGLGLAVSYQLAMRHQGHMFVESEPGVGTTFHVMIPATHPVVMAERALAPERLPIKRILIVEDEPAVSSGLKALLELDDFEVEIAATGAEAMPAAERFQPDVVILDIGLPDIDGTQVYADLDNRWPRLPVLFSSGHVNPAELDEFLRRPHVGLLTKPYDYDRLCEALRPLLEQAVRIKVA